MAIERRIIKDSTFYSISTILSQVIGVFTSIAMRRILVPEMMGIWTTLTMILNYALFAELGIFTAVQVRIPYLRGKSREKEIHELRNLAFTFAFIISGIMAVILFTFSFFVQARYSKTVIFGIRLLPFIIAATLFYNLYIVLLRADKGFQLLSKAVVFNSLAMCVCVISLGYFFKLEGMYLALFLATALSCAYIYSKVRYSVKLFFSKHTLLGLSKIGLPIFIGGMVYAFLISIDKLLIIKMIGPKELGWYSIATLAFTYAITFPKIFAIVIFPTMQEEFARHESKEYILKYVKEPAVISAYLFPALLSVLYFCMPLLVNYVLPKYASGLASMNMLLLGCFFISFVYLADHYIITINKQVMLVYFVSLASVFCWAINYAIIKSGHGIAGVALGTSIAYAIYFFSLFMYTLKRCEKWPEVMKFFFTVLLPFAYAVAVLFILRKFVSVGSLIKNTFAQAALFYISYIPMFLYINKRADIVSRILKMVKLKSSP